ncbi:MAG: M48 family peptidase [Betaproteobacteria bacterium]|jgi:Zn-dependent protease with chaperone function|nr:M48 family peptidase [Betaproteobacteria bacterium]
MCGHCRSKHSVWSARRAFVLAAGATALAPALAQVDVGKPSVLRNLVGAQQLESAAVHQYLQTMGQARTQGTLAPDSHPQLKRLRAIAQRLIPFTTQWNERARSWRWEVNLIGSQQINAYCMPGGKIAFYTGILDKLKLTDDEAAMVMGHEMAHALREHARERLAKSQATGIGLSVGAQLLGLGDLGNVAANLGTRLLTLKFGREDESEADLVGLEIAARSAFDPRAGASLWRKMAAATGAGGGPAFLSTHPSGPQRIRELEVNAPKVRGLYDHALKHG